MSLKGKVFTAKDLSTSARRQLERAEARQPGALQKHLDEQTERWRIVAKAEDGTPYVAEELQERALRTLSPEARILATMICRQPLAVRLEVIAAFDKSGELLIPFARV